MVNKKQVIKLLIYFFVIVLLFFNVNIFQAFAEDNIKSALDRNTIAINNFKLDGDFSELKEMGDILNDKKIIALGESTEGASEFYKLKSKVIEYLIQDKGYRVLIVDGNFAEIQIVDDYINGKGEIDDAIWNLRSYPWTVEKTKEESEYKISSHNYLASYTTDEYSPILEWMKEYNRKTDRSDKIKIYGIGFENPERSVEDLLEYILKVDKGNGELYKKKLDNLKLVHSLDFNYPESRALALLSGMLKEIDQDLESELNIYIDNSSLDEYIVSRKNLEITYQWIDYRLTNIESGIDDAINIKEEYMFKNIKWILDRELENENQNAIIWSNNKEINKKPRDYVSMGEHLEDEFKEDYYAMGLDFFKGKFRAFGINLWGTPMSNFISKFSIDSSKSDYFGHKLEKAEKPIYFLDFKSNEGKDNIGGMLNQEQKFHNPGLMYTGRYLPNSFLHYWTYKYIKEIPFESYDGFLFVHEIHETIGMFDERDTKIEDGDKVILDYYLEILRGQAITIFAILLLIVLTLLWLFKRFKRRKTKPGARYPGSKRW